MCFLAKYNGSVKERIIRLLIIIASAVVVLGGFKWIVTQKQKKPEVFSLSTEPIKKKLEDAGEKILGEAVKHLPQASNLKEVNQEDQSEEVEPIREPAENIQSQTQELIESIKRLPQDQVEAIKRQIFKELCEELSCGEFYGE